MQFNQADVNSCPGVGVDEHLIKFKSSPNFKNMKKFIKSRSETTTVGIKSAAMGASHHLPQLNIGKVENHHFVLSDWHRAEVQPPLPLDPPPTDNIIPDFQVKQEIEDTEYENIQQSPRLENHESIENTEQTNDSPSKICRDFIRGTCKREGTCKYAHKYDLSQLEGVYTFCRKFQNSVCTFTNCKYVHATIFEEQHFYRTGMLPAHALQHRINNILQPPPPPPPPTDTFVPFKMDFSNPPPPLPQPNEMENPIISCVPTSSMEARHYMEDIRNQMPTRSRSPLKRKWSNTESLAAPPCDLAYNEQLPKKCKHCDIMEFRLDHNKNKVTQMLQSKEQLGKKTALLEKQSEKLRSLISELLKPTISSRAQMHSTNLIAEKDKTLLEQLNNFLSANRISTFGEDK